MVAVQAGGLDSHAAHFPGSRSSQDSQPLPAKTSDARLRTLKRKPSLIRLQMSEPRAELVKAVFVDALVTGVYWQNTTTLLQPNRPDIEHRLSGVLLPNVRDPRKHEGRVSPRPPAVASTNQHSRHHAHSPPFLLRCVQNNPTSRLPFLESLPLELLTRIASHLCIHCTNTEPDLCTDKCYSVSAHFDCAYANIVNVRLQSLTLLNISLVSRRLHSAAERILYHRPNTHKWWLLVVTLLSRPDLAQAVRELYLPRHEDDEKEEGKAHKPIEAYYEKAFAAYRKSEAERSVVHSEEERKGYRDFQAREAVVSDAAGKFSKGDTSGGEIAAVLTSLCPNMEKIERFVGWDASLPYSARDSLVRLRHLEVVYWDSEGGIGLETLAGITAAAPNLEVFRGLAVVGVTNPTGQDPTGGLELRLGKLRDLELRMSVVNACPKLEFFGFEVGVHAAGDGAV